MNVQHLKLLLCIIVSLCSCRNPPDRIVQGGTDAAVLENVAPVKAEEPSTADVKATPAEKPLLKSPQTLATEILNRKCGSCHLAGNAQGNFGIIDNIEEMIAGGRYIVPGFPENSLLITKLAPKGNMPPAGSLTPEEVDVLSNWIKLLKPAKIIALAEFDVITMIRKDLELNIPAAQRLDTRYFSLHVPQSLGATPATLTIQRQALAKVINSLSRAPNILIPKAIDPDKLVYRIQLADMAMSVANFNSVMNNFYPFGQNFIAVAGNDLSKRTADDHAFLTKEMGTPLYFIRADWFAATAPLPQLYAGFLQLATTQAALQTGLGINQIQNIVDAKVFRSGFKNSNVSTQNRIVERHSQSNGLAYWLSYDFATNDLLANIFALPLGPLGIGQDLKAFKHDGGEMIFQLPNGLFGYYLATAAGVKIDKGPTSIVKQPDAPAQFASTIINGISCMSCHGAGLLYKADQIRDFIANNPGNLTVDQLAKVKSLFTEEKFFKEVFDKDNVLYFSALKTLGIDPAQADPVNQAFRYYNRGLSRNDVREELGINDAELQTILAAEPYRSQWTSLASNQGYIKRDELQSLLGQAYLNFKAPANPINPLLGDAVITSQCIFADPLKTDGCIVRKPIP